MSLTWTPTSDDDPEFTITTATQHSVLAGRSTADAHPASAITTDNDWNGNLTSAGTNLAAVLDVIDDLALGGGGGAVDSVNGETGTVVLDAADVDAVPTTRTITAGTGLTGGGDLAADRTIAADLSASNGAALGVAAPGVATTIARADHVHPMPSASDVGGIPATIIDAAGDLIVGTAADTAARLAVGTSGQVLTSNGTTAAWAAPSLPSIAASISTAAFGANEYLIGPNHAATGASVAHGLTALGREVFVPFWCPAGTYDAIGVLTTVAAASTWRLGVDDCTASYGPGAVLLDAGTVDMNAAAGWQVITGLSFVVSTAQWMWVHAKAVAYTAAPTVQCLDGIGSASSTPRIPGWPVRGALPARATVGALSILNAGSSGVLTAASGGIGPNSATQLTLGQTAPLIALRRSA